MTETEQSISDAIAKLMSVRREVITPATRINKDLGITGDDAVELLQGISKLFGVTFEDFDYTKYFDSENLNLAGAIRDLIKGKKLTLDSLSVSDLAAYVDRKVTVTARRTE